MWLERKRGLGQHSQISFSSWGSGGSCQCREESTWCPGKRCRSLMMTVQAGRLLGSFSAVGRRAPKWTVQSKGAVRNIPRPQGPQRPFRPGSVGAK